MRGLGSIIFGSKSSHLRVGEVAQIDTLVSREGGLNVRLLKLKNTVYERLFYREILKIECFL